MTAPPDFLVVPALDLVPGTLLVAVGPAASGKSTYAATAAVDAVVCLDSLRREIGGDAGDQSVTPAAVERQNTLLEQYLSTGATVFLDSTNVEPHVRAQLVERARRRGRPVVALRFLPDLDTCLTRNARRPGNRRVPDDTLRWQYCLAKEATADVLLREGFTAVHQVHTTPTGATVYPPPAPNIRFACVTDPTRRHAYFFATAEEDFDRLVAAYEREEDLTVTPFDTEFADPTIDPRIYNETRVWVSLAREENDGPVMVQVGSVENGQWVNWNLPAVPRPPVPALLLESVTQAEPAPATATVPDDDLLAPERIADAVAVLRKAQEGDQDAHQDLAAYFPAYEALVMQTDHACYLELAARAGLVATHLLLLQGGGRWLASVDTYTSDLELPLASVALGDYATRTEAVRETVRAATDHGWRLSPEHQWSDFDCGGGEIHIPIHARPTH
ncbi:AAA family ATPase [Streptomyces sp. NPDC058783]|uniref:AAA family ATPase n=1 Tax=Streptomyces sp. NPDC058783 TaxID=3346633 RepID=UPI00369863CD